MQHLTFRLALSVTRRALVLDRGRVVHRSPSEALLQDEAGLERLVGVSLDHQRVWLPRSVRSVPATGSTA